MGLFAFFYALGAMIAAIFGAILILSGILYIAAAGLLLTGRKICAVIAIVIGAIPIFLVIAQLPVDILLFVGALPVFGIAVMILRVALVPFGWNSLK